MDSRLKQSIAKELRSTREGSQNANDFSFDSTVFEKQLFECKQDFTTKKFTPFNLNKIKSQNLLRRKRSAQVCLNFPNQLLSQQKFKNFKSPCNKNQVRQTQTLTKKAISDPNILRNHQRDFSIDIDEKRKKLEEKKKEKINFINDKINKLKNINNKLSSLKDEILTQLSDQKQAIVETPQQYYIGNLTKSSEKAQSRNFTNYLTHFQRNFNLLKYLENKHHLISRPPSCQKSFKNSKGIVQPLPTLVLDLDQTLVWTTKTDKLIVMNSVYLKDKVTGKNVRHEVHLRPFVDKFLEEVSQLYQVVLFTSGSHEYTAQVLKLLDSQRKYISKVLTRDHAIKFSDEKYQVYVKDLRVLGQNLNRTVFVDNCMYSYALQLENGIPILPFNGDPNDQQLKHLLEYLKELQNYTNMAERNDEIFKQSFYQPYFRKSLGTEEIIKSLYKNDTNQRTYQNYA